MKKGHSTGKKVFSIIGNVIIWLFVIFAAVVTILTIAARSSGDGAPSIGQNVILSVKTDSMEPTIMQGDVIIGKKISSDEKKTLQVDDIITFDAGDLNNDGVRDLNTHRIVAVEQGENGKIIYQTKGDHNPTPDTLKVDSESVICKYSGQRIAYLGSALLFLQQPTGFLLIIVLPLIALFIYELIRFIRKFFELKGGNSTVTAEEEERIRQQAIEDYLRSQGGNVAEKSEEAVSEVTEAVEEAAEEATETVEEKSADE